MIDEKKCRGCGKVKSVSEYSFDKDRPHSYCKACARVNTRKWKENWFTGVWLCRKHHAQTHKELRWNTQ